MHSNVYKKADKFEDKKVVLVGSGNSAGGNTSVFILML